MSEQHLHNRIGNAIGEAKRRLLNNLKNGVELERSITEFLSEIASQLGLILKGEQQ